MFRESSALWSHYQTSWDSEPSLSQGLIDSLVNQGWKKKKKSDEKSVMKEVRARNRTMMQLLLHSKHTGQVQTCTSELTICLSVMSVYISSTHWSFCICQCDLNTWGCKSTIWPWSLTAPSLVVYCYSMQLDWNLHFYNLSSGDGNMAALGSM